MTSLRWTGAEIEFLESMTGDIPFPLLVSKFQEKAKHEGWPLRTETAIIQRVRRSGMQVRVRNGANTTARGAAELLGCPGDRVDAWLRNPKILEILQPTVVGTYRYVSRSAWRRLAREMPRVLGGCSVYGLYALLEDRDLAESIATKYKRRPGDWRVRCVETGRIYPSCIAAAKEHHVTHSAISAAIRERRPLPAIGLTFEALRTPHKKPE
jgi:hypothetical protein